MGREAFKKRAGRHGFGAVALAVVMLLATGGERAWAADSESAPQASAQNAAPEITAIAPTWGPSGSVLSLTLQGSNLQEALDVKFYPNSGIVVEEKPVVNSEGTVATVKVTILVHAPLGPRLVVVRTPAGQSSAIPTEANTFKVSFAHLH